MNFDWTIQIGDLILIAGGVFAFIRIFLSVRDALRHLTSVIGQKYPPSGLLGEVSELSEQTAEHRTWLIRAGLDK